MPSILTTFLIPSRALRFGAQAVAATLLISCGGGGGGPAASSVPPPPAPTSNTFYVGGTSTGSDGYGGSTNTPILAFTPATLTVAAGTTVTWVWEGSGHSLDSGTGCSPDNQFSSGGMQNTGYTMTHTFNTKGTFPFYCGVHCGANMKGTITVN